MGKRSPFPRKSLPQAGESLRYAAEDLVVDRCLVWAFVAILLAAVGLVELIIRWLGLPMSPWVWIALAPMYGAFSAWRWFRIRPEVRAMRQGMRGERMIGRTLEELRRNGYEVFHDIPGDGFNIDHALIGPAGVFAIETKTWSLPGNRRAEIDYDGKRVLVDGKAPDRDPIAQVEAVSDHLRDVLMRMTNRNPVVRPVLLFPGWWVKRQPKNARVWVLNPKAFPAFLRNEPNRLSPDDVALFTERLTLHLST